MTVPNRPATDPARPSILPWAWTLLVLLLLQNVVGIYLNLFVALPNSPDLAAVIASDSVLTLHVTVGFLILGSAAVIVYLAGRARRAGLWIPALSALAFALLAFSSGVEFTIGGQDDVLSFVMEIAFLGSVVSDVVVLYGGSRLRTSETVLAPGGRVVED